MGHPLLPIDLVVVLIIGSSSCIDNVVGSPDLSRLYRVIIRVMCVILNVHYSII